MKIAEENAILTLAEEKLALLNEINLELSHFIEQADVPAEEINAVFQRTQSCMDRIRQIDRLNADRIVSPPDKLRYLTLQEDQRALTRKVVEAVRLAYAKCERLSEECRSALHSVQQKKWICAQFLERPIKPGSLLDYSETLYVPRKER